MEKELFLLFTCNKITYDYKTVITNFSKMSVFYDTLKIICYLILQYALTIYIEHYNVVIVSVYYKCTYSFYVCC